MNIQISLDPTELASILLPHVRQQLHKPELTVDDLMIDAEVDDDNGLIKLLISIDSPLNAENLKEALTKFTSLQEREHYEHHGTGEQTQTVSPKPQPESERELVVGGIYRVSKYCIENKVSDAEYYEVVELEVVELAGRLTNKLIKSPKCRAVDATGKPTSDEYRWVGEDLLGEFVCLSSAK